MQTIKKGIAAILCAAMVITLAPAGSADAAKKPKLKKKVSVTVGNTVTIKVKNAKKKAKVTWKTSKEAVAKITKKKTKGKKASVTIQGVKEGKAKITAVYKLGKTKKKLKCKVTVTKADAAQPTQGVVSPATPTATSGGSGNQATEAPVVSSTPRPTRTPAPSPTPSPSPLPDDKEYNFEVPENGYAIDISTYVSASGSGGYKADKKRIEINDQAGGNSQGSWELPSEIAGSIKTGDIVTFRIQGYNYGDSGFRFWLGNPNSGGCTPVMLLNEIDESLAIDPALGYPCVKEEDGTVLEGLKTDDINKKENCKTYNQMAINADPDTKAFDVEFKFKAGTSQDDVAATFTHLTLKYIMSGGTSGYINGLSIKNIYFITDKAIEAPPTMDPDTPGIDISGATKPYGDEGEVKVNEDGTVTGTDCEAIAIPLGMDIADGEEVKVTVFGEAASKIRIWLADNQNKRWSEIQNNALFGTTYTFVADKNIPNESADSKATVANCFHIKGAQWGDKLNITVTKVVVSKDEPGGDGPDTSAEPEGPNLADPYEVDLSKVSTVTDGIPGSPATVTYNEETKSLDATMPGMQGFIVRSPITESKDDYKYVEITYTQSGNDVGIFAGQYDAGTGQGATGWSPDTNITKLEKDKETTLLLSSDDYLEGAPLGSIKIFNYGGAATISIKSITFYKDGAKNE